MAEQRKSSLTLDQTDFAKHMEVIRNPESVSHPEKPITYGDLDISDLRFLMQTDRAIDLVNILILLGQRKGDLTDKEIKAIVGIAKSLDKYETEKRVMTRPKDVRYEFANGIIFDVRYVPVLNIVWDLFFDMAPTVDQIRSTVESIGLLGALSLSVAIGYPTAFDYEELRDAQKRFENCEEDYDPVREFGISCYNTLLFNAASVCSSILIIFMSCATDLGSPEEIKSWWQWTRVSVLVAMTQCFLGAYYSFACLWQLIQLKWPMPDILEGGDDGGGDDDGVYKKMFCGPPDWQPFGDDTPVWVQNFWFSKILIYATFVLILAPMSIRIAVDAWEKNSETKSRPQQTNKVSSLGS